MVVGDDIAIGRDDEARAERAAALGDAIVVVPTAAAAAAVVIIRNGHAKPAEEFFEAGRIAALCDGDALFGRNVDDRRLKPLRQFGEAHRPAGARCGSVDRSRLVLRGLRARRVQRDGRGGSPEQ
jgi:hypothetical protein